MPAKNNWANIGKPLFQSIGMADEDALDYLLAGAGQPMENKTGQFSRNSGNGI